MTVGAKLLHVLHDLFERFLQTLNKYIVVSTEDCGPETDRTKVESLLVESANLAVSSSTSISPSETSKRSRELRQSPLPVSRYFRDSSTRKKYYAVVRGYNPGVYESWEDCEPQVRGYSGQIFKSFKTRVEAEHFLQDGFRKAEEHARHGHRFRHVGSDSSGKKVYRCEYCLEMYQNAMGAE